MSDDIDTILLTFERVATEAKLDDETTDTQMVRILVKNRDEAKQAITKLITDTEKAYGGCHNCYGKGYATVNEYASGYATDGDIGGAQGYFKFKQPNIKFCSCDRGKQLAELQSNQDAA